MSINNDLESSMSGSNREASANYAATLLYYQNRNRNVNFSPSQSDLLSHAGISGLIDYGCMSPVRRTFCLLVMFDLIFIFLLWLLYAQILNKTQEGAFTDEVVKYNISHSMFDTVLLSSGRFVILISAYAIFKINHWWMIAISTTGSCVFLIYKGFAYTFKDGITLDYVLLIVSFLLAWVETWFLDFKVLPAERKARQLLAQRNQTNEQSSLLGTNGIRNYTDGTAASFYSPLDSEDEGEEPSANEKFQSVSVSRGISQDDIDKSGMQDEEYVQKSKEAVQNVWKIVNSDGWKLDKEFDGVTVVGKYVSPWGKFFKLVGTVNLKPRLLLEEFFYHLEKTAQWNPTVLESRILYTIDSQTDIAYNVAAEAAGGLVKSRDFINLRRWEQIDGAYVMAGIGITYPSMPPQPEHVRGENGPGAWVISPVEGHPDKSVFQWLLNTNLKGWLPQAIIDQSLATVMWKTLISIQNRAKQLQKEN